jgi:hypothetical protein
MRAVASREAHGREIRLLTGGDPVRPSVGQEWLFEVNEVARFCWRSGQTAVFHQLLHKGNAGLLTFWFVHLLLPLYLTLEQRYHMLHASAIELDGKPVLFLAPSMGGKSTLSGHFVQQGHPLISDDKVPAAIAGALYLVGGSHPYHRPLRRNEELGCRVERFSPEFRPVHTLYLLQRCAPSGPVSVEEIVGFRKFAAMLPNQLFSLDLYREQQLNVLSHLLNQSRLYRVALPWSKARLPEVYDAVRTHHLSLA